MEIVSKTEGSKMTMEISGWLDTQTAPQLEKELSALGGDITSLVFDFAALEYISSAGLRLVIAAYKKWLARTASKLSMFRMKYLTFSVLPDSTRKLTLRDEAINYL